MINIPVEPKISVIIAARNEQALIGRCLCALAGQRGLTHGTVEVIVAANGCTDDTVARALETSALLFQNGINLKVIDLPKGDKLAAIAEGEGEASGANIVYLDADVVVESQLLFQLLQVLETDCPRYATGTISIVRGESLATRAYARVWAKLPFARGRAAGAGLFALNAAGRARWSSWPDIISDDTFARLHFKPDERIEVPAHYHWPMVEGFWNLVRVRRRQNAGVTEIAKLYPSLLVNEGKEALTAGLIMRLAMSDPLGFAIYVVVHVVVMISGDPNEWSRGR